MAVRTKSAAGRACRSTPSGSATVTMSELVGTFGLLGSTDDVVEPDPGARGDRRGDGALDDGGVRQADVTVRATLEQRADGEDRRAEVAEHAHAAARAPRALDRVGHAVLVSAQPAV